MKTGHRNQLKPRLADAAPASTVGLTDTKAYTPRWTPIEIETYGRETNDKEDLRGQPQLLRVQQPLVCHNLGATQHIHVSEGRQSDALSKKFHNQFIVRNVAPIM